MIRTRVTELFGIKYPIMQGGMQHLGIAELASAVCNAGGLGTINITCFPTPDAFREELKKMQDLTDQPYAVNFTFLPEFRQSDEDHLRYHRLVDICAEEGVAVVETAGGDPSPYLPAFHAGGIKVLHKAPNVKVAKRMEEKGVDAVSIIGYEVAGHPSMDGIGTIVMANRVASELKIPVLAAGGIADGKGLAAALSLGCDGIVMGTRFVATKECPISQAHKDWILSHNERDTTLLLQSIKNLMRAANNGAAQACQEMEAKHASIEELLSVISGNKGKQSFETGDVDGGMFCVGPAIGLIRDIPSVKELLDGMVSEAEEIIMKLSKSIV